MFQLGEHVMHPPGGGLQNHRPYHHGRQGVLCAFTAVRPQAEALRPHSVLKKDRRAGFGQRGRTAQPVPGGRAGGHPLDCRPERQVPPIRRIRTERGPAGNPEAFQNAPCPQEGKAPSPGGTRASWTACPAAPFRNSTSSAAASPDPPAFFRRKLGKKNPAPALAPSASGLRRTLPSLEGRGETDSCGNLLDEVERPRLHRGGEFYENRYRPSWLYRFSFSACFCFFMARPILPFKSVPFVRIDFGQKSGYPIVVR